MGKRLLPWRMASKPDWIIEQRAAAILSHVIQALIEALLEPPEPKDRKHRELQRKIQRMLIPVVVCFLILLVIYS